MSENKYELRKQVKSVRWMIFWVVLAQFAAEVLIEAVVSFMSNPPHRYIQIAVIEILAIGVPIAIYAKTIWHGNGKKTKAELGLTPCRIGYIILAAVLGVSGQFVMMILNVPANIIVNQIWGKATIDAIPIAQRWQDLLIGVFAVVIIPAVLEEFWMRGLIFRVYNRCNTKAAIIFTSLIFALLHIRVNEMAGFLFMGIVSALILIKSKSLYASMVYHSCSNLTALLFSVYIMPAIIDYIWFVFAGIILVFAVSLLILLKQKAKMRKNVVFDTGTFLITSLLSMPVILSVLTAVAKYFMLKMAG
jgi:membrane protease YdiL (CAAX protease family)